MDNPIIPNPIPDSVRSINQAPVKPIKSNKFLVLLLLILLIITLGIAGFFFFQTQKLSKELIKYQSATPTPTATPIGTNKCIEKNSLNCEGEPELSFECSDEYQSWARVNCPGWEEIVNCNEPRPEVCTMECVETPPYICGSDSKSYCSICQACSNTSIDWYVIRNTPCEEGFPL